MSKPKVLLTRHWPESVEVEFQKHFDVRLNTSDKPLSVDQLQAALQEYDAICPTVTDKITAELFQNSATRTRIIANYGVGYNHIDVKATTAKGIVITNTPDVLTDATADLAMTLLLMLARRAGEGERQVRNGQWLGWHPTHMMGSMVTGKTLGIVGMGRIGMAMACKAAYGFDMKILYHGRRQMSDAELDGFQATYCPDLETLLPQCNFVSLHCPASSETRHMINAQTLALMPKDCFLINTSRGDVIDEKALLQALQKKTIAGAGLDVYAREPEIPEVFLKLENIALLPHLGSATLETRVAMGMRVLKNLQAFFKGELVPDRVN